MLRNSLLAALVNYVRVVMQLPGYGCQFSCERFIRSIYMLGTTTELSMLFKFWGCGYSYT